MALMSLKGLQSVSIDDSAGTARVVTDLVTRIEYQDNTEEDEITSVGATGSRYVAEDPIRFDRLLIDLLLDDAADSTMAILFPRTGKRTVDIKYQTGNSGNAGHHFTMEAVITGRPLTVEGRRKSTRVTFTAADQNGLVHDTDIS